MTPSYPPLSRTLLGIGAVAVLLTACAKDNADDTAATEPQTVQVVRVASKPLPVTRGLPGRTAPYRVAFVRPQVSGLIEQRLFQEGDLVKRGQPLYQVDRAEYEAAFNAARAEVARTEAQAKAAANQAERVRELIGSNVVSKQDLDAAAAAADETRAEVAAAKATLESARIQLDRTTVKAPIEGRIGRSLATEGALVTANQDEELAVITTLDPIYVDLSQTSADVLRWKRKIAAGELDTGDRNELPVRLTLEDGSVYPHKGTLQFSDVRVNATTGGILVRAKFPNPDGLLMPGMFVTAEIFEGMRDAAILIPQQAVMRTPRGEGYVYVVNDDDTVEQRDIEIDRAVANEWLIRAGLRAGERVMTAGFQFVKPGAVVRPVEIPDAGAAAVAGGGFVITTERTATDAAPVSRDGIDDGIGDGVGDGAGDKMPSSAPAPGPSGGSGN